MYPAIPIAKMMLATRGGMHPVPARSGARPRSSLGQQQTVDELQRQELVNGGCVVAVSLDVPVDHALDGSRIQIRARERRRIQEDVSHPCREGIAVPDP